MFDDMDWMSDFLSGETSDLETTEQLARPKVHLHKAEKRRFINGLKQEALTELLPTLPDTDTDVYVIGNGSGAEIKHGINAQAFDFGTFIPHVVNLMGNRECIVYVSTWTMNRNHGLTFLEMVDDKRIAQMTLITDSYWKRRESAVANEVISGLMARGQRYLAFKNHVKSIAIQAPDGTTCVITGSANLSAQPRCEQYVVTTAPDVYRFFVDEFFEAMFDAR